MNNQITSQVIGPLTQDASFDDWWNSEPVAIPLLDGQPIPITFTDYEPAEDEKFMADADQALTNFLQLDKTYRESISHLVHKNCMEFLEAVGYDEQDKEMWEIKDPNEIWRFVHPTSVYIKRRSYHEKDIYVQIECNCDWEQEHGLQLVFRQGKKITRVSDVDGHLTEADAYAKPDKDDELLSQF